MNFRRIEGPARTLECAGCGGVSVGGTEPYTSASTGDPRVPEEWYECQETRFYCTGCATKLVSAHDPTRSVNQFYQNTSGVTESFTIFQRASNSVPLPTLRN